MFGQTFLDLLFNTFAKKLRELVFRPHEGLSIVRFLFIYYFFETQICIVYLFFILADMTMLHTYPPRSKRMAL